MSVPQQFYEMLLRSQYWSADQMIDYQRSQLGQMLRDARRSIPFYAARLEALFREDGQIDWDRWTELPIITRADLAAFGDTMLAPSLPPGHGSRTTTSTSGTTGAPINVMSTRLSHIALNANRFRAYGWHAIDWSKDICTVLGGDPADAAWPNGKKLGAWGPEWDPASIDGTNHRINTLADYGQILEFIGRVGASYFSTGPTTAFALALEAERLGIRLKVDAYLPQGGAISDFERETILRVFGARTAELYSAKEGAHMAHGCPEFPGLHVNAESLLLEIVDEEGHACPTGQPGRVVITPFFNAAQPLVRYDLGDTAEWMAPCPCGRCLPRMASVIGRSVGYVYHPDGRIRSSFLWRGERPLLKCRDWQIAQTGPHQFEVRYVPIDWDVMGDEPALAARLRQLYFDDAEVSFLRVREIPAGPGGKPEEYVSAWQLVR